MRVEQNTSACLRLRDRTLWMSLVCFCAGAYNVAEFIESGTTPGLLVVAAVCALFGLLFTRATDVVLDKVGRTCRLRRLDVFKFTRHQLAFQEIENVQVEASPGGDSNSINCRLSLVTASGSIPLTIGYEPDLQRYDTMREVVVETVFADRPPPPPIDPVRTLVRAGHRSAAIRVLCLRDRLDLKTAEMRVREMA